MRIIETTPMPTKRKFRLELDLKEITKLMEVQQGWDDKDGKISEMWLMLRYAIVGHEQMKQCE